MFGSARHLQGLTCTGTGGGWYLLPQGALCPGTCKQDEELQGCAFDGAADLGDCPLLQRAEARHLHGTEHNGALTTFLS